MDLKVFPELTNQKWWISLYPDDDLMTCVRDLIFNQSLVYHHGSVELYRLGVVQKSLSSYKDRTTYHFAARIHHRSPPTRHDPHKDICSQCLVDTTRKSSILFHCLYGKPIMPETCVTFFAKVCETLDFRVFLPKKKTTTKAQSVPEASNRSQESRRAISSALSRGCAALRYQLPHFVRPKCALKKTSEQAMSNHLSKNLPCII